MPDFQQRLAILSGDNAPTLLSEITRGVEKESLRVDERGQLALTAHPVSLGSALTHPRITTDYSEALLEFITPPSTSVTDILQTLEDIHRYTYRQIGDELLWVNSMPCVLGRDEDIPVARYGNSNSGTMKYIYRIGLGHRYGRLMQTIAGIHYNFSLPDRFWRFLQQQEAPDTDLQVLKTDRYFGLIRNFRRNFWLLLYLFGAAPAVCHTFVKNRVHPLLDFGEDRNSRYMPYATSLRMGDLGYQSRAQNEVAVCYNTLQSYVDTLLPALTTPYPAYQKTGLKNGRGDYLQLNTHLLQIENEFYSAIRPKRTTEPGETPLRALASRGVEYIEVRCIDLNPYDPVGISAEQMYFLDTFLLYCLLQGSPETHTEEYYQILENQRRTVYHGRDPALTLLKDGREYSAKLWRDNLFRGLEEAAGLLDAQQNRTCHLAALKTFRRRLDDPEQIPSARILNEMRNQGKAYFHVALEHARKHREYFLNGALPPEQEAYYRELAETSLARQKQVEASDRISFGQYLDNYFSQYSHTARG